MLHSSLEVRHRAAAKHQKICRKEPGTRHTSVQNIARTASAKPPRTQSSMRRLSVSGCSTTSPQAEAVFGHRYSAPGCLSEGATQRWGSEQTRVHSVRPMASYWGPSDILGGCECSTRAKPCAVSDAWRQARRSSVKNFRVRKTRST